MAINISLNNIDEDVKFVALNEAANDETGYDKDVVIQNVFYVEDILTILFFNPRGAVKFNNAPLDMDPSNDGAKFVTEWFVKHGHKLHLETKVDGNDVTIKSNNWQCTLKVMQTYKDDNKVKYLTEDRNDVFIKDPDDVTGVVEWTETECAWQDFVKAFEHKNEDYCELCHLDKDICTTCLVKHFQAMLNK
jgi:hypothetical protein